MDPGLSPLPAVPFLLALALVAALLLPRILARPVNGLAAMVTVLPVTWVGGTSGPLLRLALPDVIAGMTLVAVALMLRFARESLPGDVRLPGPALIGLLGLATAMAMSLSRSEAPGRSLAEGAALAVNAATFLLFPLLVRTRADLRTMLTAWERAAALAVAGAAVGVLLLAAGRVDTPFTEGHKVASFAKKSSQLSAVLLPMVPFVAVRWLRAECGRARFLRGALLVGMLVTFAATGSRLGMVVGGGGCVVALLLPALRSLPRLRPAPVVLAVSGILLLAMALAPRAGRTDSLPFAFQRSLSFLTAPSDVRALSPHRGYQWDAWRVAATEHPWTGVGAGAAKVRMTSYSAGAFTPHEIHSTILGVWAETGLVGALSLTLLVATLLGAAGVTALRADDAFTRAFALAVAASLALLFVYGMGNYGLRMRHLWAVLGLAAAAWNVGRAATSAAATSSPSGPR